MKAMKQAKTTLATIALAIGLSAGVAKAQVGGSVEGIKSFEPGQSYVRPTVTFQLPEDIKGSSFLELYGEKGYFGKTTLSKQVEGPVSALVQAVYGSSFDTRYGVGASIGGQIADGVYAKAHIIPFWVDDEAKLQKYKSVVGYYIGADLPLDMKLSSFGEIKLDGEKGPEWAYGEIELQKKITEAISVSYQPALKMERKGQVTPTLEHRVAIKVKL